MTPFVFNKFLNEFIFRCLTCDYASEFQLAREIVRILCKDRARQFSPWLMDGRGPPLMEGPCPPSRPGALDGQSVWTIVHALNWSGRTGTLETEETRTLRTRLFRSILSRACAHEITVYRGWVVVCSVLDPVCCAPVHSNFDARCLLRTAFWLKRTMIYVAFGSRIPKIFKNSFLLLQGGQLRVQS